MKKFTAIILISALLLTACTNSEVPESSDTPSSSTSSSDSENSSTSNSTLPPSNSSSITSDSSSSKSSENSSEPSDNNDDNLKGSEITDRFELPKGYPIDLTDAVAIRYDLWEYGGEMPISEICNSGYDKHDGGSNWQSVICNFIYLANAKGIFYNSIDNADIYDEDNLAFSNVQKTVSYEYKMYKAGDKIGELTISSAQTIFKSENRYLSPKYHAGYRVNFDGQIILTGWCSLAPETQGYIYMRDIHFVPDAESCDKLPIPLEVSNELVNGMEYDFCWLGEYYAPIRLGNADQYSNLDFHKFPDDGSFVKVKVTVDNISCGNGVFYGNIVDLEIV